jgi:hypothetical protein
MKLIEDVLVAYKKKDLDAYMVGPQTEMPPAMPGVGQMPVGPQAAAMGGAPAPGEAGVDLSQALAGAPVG